MARAHTDRSGVTTHAACSAVLVDPRFRPGVFELMRRGAPGSDVGEIAGAPLAARIGGAEHQALRRAGDAVLHAAASR